jgi:hypothetical protein
VKFKKRFLGVAENLSTKMLMGHRIMLPPDMAWSTELENEDRCTEKLNYKI